MKKEDITYTKVFNEWVDDGISKRTNYQLPVIDSDEPEHILFAISMFEKHSSPDLLNLDTASNKFSKFYTILCGENQDIWREIIDNVKNQMNKTFKNTKLNIQQTKTLPPSLTAECLIQC